MFLACRWAVFRPPSPMPGVAVRLDSSCWRQRGLRPSSCPIVPGSFRCHRSRHRAAPYLCSPWPEQPVAAAPTGVPNRPLAGSRFPAPMAGSLPIRSHARLPVPSPRRTVPGAVAAAGLAL